jgi:hypothetical protein
MLEAEQSEVKLAHKTWEKHASGTRRIFKDLVVDRLPAGMTKELWVCLALEPEDIFPR